MGVALEGKIGQGLQVEDIGTGQHEEVTEHPVAGPGLGQGGQTVEQEKGATTRLADLRPNLGNKPLKAQGDIQMADLARIVLLEQGGMLGEAEVNQAATLFPRRPAIGRHQGREIRDVIDVPDEVVAGQQPPEDAVEGRDAGAEVGFDHADTWVCGKLAGPNPAAAGP